MRKAATKKKKAARPVPLCYNCDVAMDLAALFCTDLCKQEAALVRYVRSVRQQRRENEPDIVKAIRIKMVHIFNGGYPDKARHLSDAIRRQVIERAMGMCETEGCKKPGAEIDHIHGNSRDLSNLQYLCKECHEKKTEAGIKPVTPDDPRYEELREHRLRLARRYMAKTPLRECDDHEKWDGASKIHMQNLLAFFANRSH